MWGFVKIILCRNDSADLVLLENFEMFLARVVYDDSLATSHFKIFHYPRPPGGLRIPNG